MSEDLIKEDETALRNKLSTIEARITALEQIAVKPMPDEVKQKLKDVLTWLIATL